MPASPCDQHSLCPSDLPPVNSHSRVFAVDGFLSSAEARALRAHGADCFRRQRGARARAATESTAIGSTACPAGRLAVLLSQVEARISALTGLPAHEGEESFMLTQQHSGTSIDWLDGSRVHHDKINAQKEARNATVLVYLTSASDEHGGHTIFPTLRSADAPAARSVGKDESQQSLAALAHVVRSAYHRGVRSLGCQACAQSASVPPTAEEQAAMEQAHKHGEDECLRATDGSSRGLAVRPAVGTALIFWSVLPNGEPDADMWHAGCLARSGANRWALQKFKRIATGALQQMERNLMDETTRVSVRAADGQIATGPVDDDGLDSVVARAMATML
jgi:hypothetical protein